ncbi:hypothetical protein PLESTB_000996800 [Pleodorina starrii]|uniref:Uncharacterized protein n=1 Tax=Pleodorina starrii TaxID=330485 RepID=A0A9W6BP32_9CHLO|nr:hypothetical protein PLESTM_001855800 [Pleodorina starrii]GLC55523.1 hypothetical protein PLESTB_000996800 [Pleodorina starrii]GLC76404.1 hypothetical protein PLESTF_001777100 [Pleodorina starrii]
MAPVDVERLAKIYFEASRALSGGVSAVVTAALNACGIPDPGFVGWLVEKLVGRALDTDGIALAIAVCLEYAKRTGSLRKGLRLNNHCSLCGLKGHNRQNHSEELDEFLEANGLIGLGEDITGAIEAAGM